MEIRGYYILRIMPQLKYNAVKTTDHMDEKTNAQESQVIHLDHSLGSFLLTDPRLKSG